VKISYASIFVDDQDKALKFYTEVLGFLKKSEFPVGEFKWLTVVSPENPEGVELLLEPNDNPAANQFQQALFAQGIPATSFAVADIQQEYQRLKNMGVEWTQEPTPQGPVTVAVFADTCGNLIQIAQRNASM
jgi:catechol 2,3-dioxygenase-like lactoylglutathione lyase family enzyme